MAIKPSAIGLFDSGLGGLTVLREMKRRLPHERFIYLGDTARTPYGTKSPETIVRYARECGDFLNQQHLKMLVIACNTASSYALSELRARYDIPVLGTIAPAVKAALAATRTGSVLVLGTKATIASKTYQDTLRANDAGVRIFEQACPLFVPLVEEGLLDGPVVESAVEHYLKRFLKTDIDTIILGCTHYPLLRGVLERYFGPEVTLVECSTVLADEAATLLGASVASTESVSSDQFFVTDDPKHFCQHARLFLQSEAVIAERVLSLAA